MSFVSDVPCGVVWFVCCCVSLCVWLLVFEMKCLAAVFASYCAMMCDAVWSVCVFVSDLCVICWRLLFNRA